MRALLDANVLFPTVMREILIGVAKAGLYHPLWSARILREWELAAARLGPAQAEIAKGEIALLRADFPKAEVAEDIGLERRLWLPDAADIHVLAAAIRGSADVIVTQNRADFPRATLREEGLDRIDADTFLIERLRDRPGEVAAVVEAVRAEAERLSGEPWQTRTLLKKARLPRLGKALV